MRAHFFSMSYVSVVLQLFTHSKRLDDFSISYVFAMLQMFTQFKRFSVSTDAFCCVIHACHVAHLHIFQAPWRQPYI